MSWLKINAMSLAISMLAPAFAADSTVDQFTGVTRTATAWIELDNGCRGVIQCLADQSKFQAALVGTLSRDRLSATHCLIVDYEGDNWAFFAGAHDANGAELAVTVVDRRLGQSFSSRGVTERLCVALSKPYLGQAEGPLTVRIEGKGRTFIVNLPAVARAEYLAAIANWPDNAVPRARRVQLGVQYKPVGAEMLGQIAPGYTTGHLVMGVAPLSLAEVSGIKVGDVIVQIDGQATPAGEVLSDLAQAWTSTNPGRLTVLRAGKPTEVTIAPR